jgi:hypothetical protein
MGSTRVHKGRMTEGDRPDWRPLFDAVREELAEKLKWRISSR